MDGDNDGRWYQGRSAFICSKDSNWPVGVVVHYSSPEDWCAERRDDILGKHTMIGARG